MILNSVLRPDRTGKEKNQQHPNSRHSSVRRGIRGGGGGGWGGGGGGGGGGTSYKGLYENAPPEMSTIFNAVGIYERLGISRVGVYKREGKTVL